MRNTSLIIATLLTVSACTPTQQQIACNADKLAPAIVAAGAQIAEQASPGSTQDAELAKTIDATAHAAAQAACASLVAPTSP
jgi:hypothetical protein